MGDRLELRKNHILRQLKEFNICGDYLDYLKNNFENIFSVNLVLILVMIQVLSKGKDLAEIKEFIKIQCNNVVSRNEFDNKLKELIFEFCNEIVFLNSLSIKSQIIENIINQLSRILREEISKKIQ